MKLKQGSTLQNGRFTIIKVLGQGGFGITYLAKNEMLDKLVAIKEFFPSDFCDRDNYGDMTVGTKNNLDLVDKLKHRFIKEARNIAKLDHPGIVKIYDIFEEKNTAYYVMEFVEGENLHSIVKRNGSMPEETAVNYITKVADALGYIHSRNMTHFDVKPANIMVRSRDLMPILIDFGLSKQYDYEGNATSTMLSAFSPGYSAIELYNVQSVTEFSPQTDVYSLGATLYYLLTGKTPPVPSDIIINGLDFPDGIRPELQNAIRTAMDINRSKRPESMKHFVDSLHLTKVTDDKTQVIHPDIVSSETPAESSNSIHHSSVSSSRQSQSQQKTQTKVPVIGTHSSKDENYSPPKHKSHNKNSSNKVLVIPVIILICLITVIGISVSNNGDGYDESWPDSVPVEVIIDSAEYLEEPVIVEEEIIDTAGYFAKPDLIEEESVALDSSVF